MPTHGFLGVMPGNEAIVGAAGPVARSLRDLELFKRTVLAARPWELDTSMPPMPWVPVRLEQGAAPLRIGVVRDDGRVRPVRAISDALDETVQKLERQGIEVVDFDSPDHTSHWDLLVSRTYRVGERHGGLRLL
jgi:amidase